MYGSINYCDRKGGLKPHHCYSSHHTMFLTFSKSVHRINEDNDDQSSLDDGNMRRDIRDQAHIHGHSIHHSKVLCVRSGRHNDHHIHNRQGFPSFRFSLELMNQQLDPPPQLMRLPPKR